MGEEGEKQEEEEKEKENEEEYDDYERPGSAALAGGHYNKN